MKAIFSIVMYLLCNINASSQGIEFTKSSAWKDVLAKARAAGKLVFVDVYTDWCGPCKRMDKEVFALPAVGDTFNAKFINYKLNAEQREGEVLKRRYRVTSYPTYLFVRSDGTLVYKTLGAMSPDRFIAVAEQARIQAREKLSIRQLDSLYVIHKKDKAFLYTYLQQRTLLGLENADLLDAYFTLLNDKEQRMLKNLQLVVDNGSFLHKSLQIGPAFNALMSNSDRFSLLQTDVYTRNLTAIKNEAIDKTLRVAIADKNDSLFRELLVFTDKNDIFDNDDVLELRYLWGTKQYDTYIRHAIAYVDGRLMRISDRMLDKMDQQTYKRVLPSVDASLAGKTELSGQEKADIRYGYRRSQTIQWTNTVIDICRHLVRITEDSVVLKHCLIWVNRCMRLSEKDLRYFKNAYPIYVDAYACFLYVLGERDAGVEQEQKAIDLIKDLTKGKVPEQYVLRLSRMTNKEKLQFHE